MFCQRWFLLSSPSGFLHVPYRVVVNVPVPDGVPIHHGVAEWVRSHVFLCMLAYYVEWHMRQALAPILFDDDNKLGGEALRESVVAPARRSHKAESQGADQTHYSIENSTA